VAPRMAHGGREPLCAGGGRAPYSDGTWRYPRGSSVRCSRLEHGVGIAGDARHWAEDCCEHHGTRGPCGEAVAPGAVQHP
jgi:hypothetical protein